MIKFHPSLQRWFHERFPGFSDIQKKALPYTLAGRNTLILAPTGSGKTLAAFLSLLSNLAKQAEATGLPNSVCAIYISPLKALGRDIQRNLDEPLAALNAALPEARQIRVALRTGDTDFSDRGKQQRKRPHLLLTTPESLSAILSQAGWRKEGFAPRCAIVDEVHALAENKRGSMLSLALERLEQHAVEPMQRIGLSATAWPPEVAMSLLCGNRDCAIASVDLRRAHRLEIAAPASGEWLPAAGYNPYRVAQPVADLVEAAQCSLVFTSTRSAAERLALALKILLPQWDEKIAVHHGSVDRETRHEVESGLADGSLKAVVCSTSLELGVDFKAVDQVLLIGAPRGVSRAMQRLGRSGHRVNGVATGALVPLSLPDLLQCVALREAAQSGRLDALKIPSAPLDVLAQVLLGMSIEGPWDPDEAFALVRAAGPYSDLPRSDFDAVLEYLAGGGKVLGPYGTYGKIVFDSDGLFAVASRKVARTYYLNTGVISDDYQIKVVSRGNRRIGEVEENFLASLLPGEGFVLAGKAVAVKQLHQNLALVEPATGQRLRTPRWMGGKMSLSAQLGAEELRLRRSLRCAWEQGGGDACRVELRDHWRVGDTAIEHLIGFIERQNRAAPIPIDSPVQVERIREGRRTLLLLFHVVGGRAVNRSLAWVMARRVADGGSVVANFDDHSFLLSVDARKAPDEARIREGFNPQGWSDDLRRALEDTETLGRKFRAIAEVGQLLPRRTPHGETSARSSSWSGSLLYKTLLLHEPEHPLVREAVREALEDQCDATRALEQAARVYASPFEIYDLKRPSPFALPLFAAFNRETLMAQDPDKALDDLVAEMYAEWE